jgi:hypothetical protein
MPIQMKRPEPQKTAHDKSDVFDELNAKPSSPAFRYQPGQGKVSGFDFYRDPLNSAEPRKVSGYSASRAACSMPLDSPRTASR